AAVRWIVNSWRRLLHLIRVLPDTRRPIGSRPAIESLLAGLQVLVAAMPCLQSRILKRPPVGEADLPRLGAREPVDCVQRDGGQSRMLTARQEHAARHRRRHVPAQAPQGRGRNLIYRGLALALLAREDHVGLEQYFFERDSLLEEGVE